MTQLDTVDPATTSASHSITVEELSNMGGMGRCELLHGELIMMSPAFADHGVIASRIGIRLGAFVDDNDLGLVFAAETGFILARNPDVVRAPDSSFVRKNRLAGRQLRGYFDGAPDLAVEVNSTGDTRKEIADKINMWLARGCSVVWEADPLAMTVTIHRVGQPPVRLKSSDVISDEPLLPGFTLPLAKVFRVP